MKRPREAQGATAGGQKKQGAKPDVTGAHGASEDGGWRAACGEESEREAMTVPKTRRKRGRVAEVGARERIEAGQPAYGGACEP